MQKSLFKKYLRVTSLIIAICFIFLIIIMITIVSRQWRDEKRDLLGKNASAIATLAGNNTIYDAGSNKYIVEELIIRSYIGAIAGSSNTDIFITGTNGERWFGTYANSKTDPTSPVPQAILDIAASGMYAAQGTLDGAYNRPYYIVGIPIRVKAVEGNDMVIGVVFSATNADSQSLYWKESLHMFFWVGVTIFMVAFCIVWLFSYRMVTPLRQMARAARCFGAGDFSMRIPVSSEDEIGQLANALNNMATSLASSESMRRNFIANVSHELKTPMTTIAGFIDGILDGTIPEKEGPRYLHIVSQEIKRLSRLVRTMLDLSRIDSGELKIRSARFDLTKTVCNTLLTFEKTIEEKQITIHGLEDAQSLPIDGDPDMLHQVVYNLMENAVKFTDMSGYIEIQILDLEDRASVAIRNSGPGIAPDEIGMIFDRFYKTDKSRSQDKNGMGLGLYIVETIIRLHNGEITATSVQNEYTEFKFWIPKKPEPIKLKEGAIPVQDAQYEEKTEN